MSRFFAPQIQLLDASGAAASAGTLTFFAQGTTTLQNTFQDAARTLANTNPVTVNGSGLSPVIYLQYLDYTVLAEDSDGATLWQEDFDGRWLQDGSDYTQGGTGSVARTVQSRLAERVSVTDFGATGDGITNDAPAINLALQALKTEGGGTCFFPNGTYALSTGATPAWCLTIPANINLVGESRQGTIITRLVLEEASILMVNEDADTATVYNAAGNITIENMTIRDSDTAERTQNTIGDLIAFGHGEKLIVQNCNFGKHTQHCLDIGGSKNILFTGNVQENDNGATGAAENSAVQVDSAQGAAFSGLNVDGTESTDVTITNNRFINLNSNTLLHIGHNDGTAKNVIISNNYLKGTTRSFARLIRTDVDGASVDGLVISNNIIDVTTANNAAISILTNGNDSEFLSNITITGNVIKGLGRFGIIVGSTDSFLGSTYPPIENITIQGNTIDLDQTGSTVNVGGIVLNLTRAASVTGNTIRLTKDTDDVDIFGIDVVSCLQVVVDSNTVSANLDAYVGTKNSAGIRVSKFGAVATSSDMDVSVIGNNVDVSAYKFGLFCTGQDNNDFVLFSRNRFNGALTNGDAHIREEITASDGSNGFRQIVLPGAVFQLAIANDTTTAVSTGLIKTTNSTVIRSREKIEINYTSGATSSLSTATETITDNASTIALQVKNIDVSAGTFDIVTGSAGITATINPGGGASTRTAGSISVQAGI